MESFNANNNSELLTRLNRLEDQVSMLSSQLESSKITISQLNQSLSDRDLQISELEQRLTTAHNSLQKTTINKIYQCREQIKKGIDATIVNPVLTQIQKYIDMTEGLIAEARDFINKKRAFLHENLNATTNLMSQSPDQAIRYFEKTVVEPAHTLIKNILVAVDSNNKAGKVWLEQELVGPGKVLIDRIVFTVRELPLDTRIIIQTRVIDPALALVGHLPSIINNLGENSVVRFKSLLIRLSQLIQQCLDFIEDQIKKSSFWDGKTRMQAA